MKLIEALQKVKKDRPHEIDHQAILEACGMEFSEINFNKFNQIICAYWVQKHLCTDTSVGTEAVYFKDQLIGVAERSARKSDYCFSFIDAKAAKKVKEFLETIVINGHEDQVLSEEAKNREIGKYFNLEFASQIMSRSGYVNDREVIILGDAVKNEPTYIAQHNKVKFLDDGTTKIVRTENINLKLNVEGI